MKEGEDETACTDGCDVCACTRVRDYGGKHYNALPLKAIDTAA